MFPVGHGIDKNLNRDDLKKAVHAYIHSNGSAPPAPVADDAAAAAAAAADDDDDEPIAN